MGAEVELERDRAPTVDTPAREVDAADGATPRPASDLGSAVVQAKLSVGPAGDAYEREADAVAARVVRSISAAPASDRDSVVDEAPRVQRSAIARDVSDGDGEDEDGQDGEIVGGRIGRIQRSSDIGVDGGALDDDTARMLQSSRSGGKPLPDPARSKMESAFGADFSAVKVHTGATSSELNDRIQAKAFTTGRDIYFRDGLPDVSQRSGQELLAHELTHTIQQGAATARRSLADPETIQRRGGKNRKKKRKKGGGQKKKSAAQEVAAILGRPTKVQKAPDATVPSADSSFTRLAPIIDLAVPAPGDSGALEASAKIPLGPGSFLVFDFEGEVERDDDGIEAEFSITVGYGGGGSLPFGLSASIVAKLGGVVTMKAHTSTEVMKLMSYGFFRQFRESNLVPREMTDALWGGEAGTGAAANEWGAGVENEIFAGNDEASVGVGLVGAAEAAVEAGDNGGKITAKLTSSTNYSKESIEGTGDKQLGGSQKKKDTASYAGWAASKVGRGAEATIGEVERKVAIEAELEVGPISGEASYEGVLPNPRKNYELEAAGTGKLSGSDWKPVKLAQTAVDVAARLRGIAALVGAKERSKEQVIGEAAGTAVHISEYVDACEASRTRLAKEFEERLGGESSSGIEIAWKLESEGKKQKRSLTVSRVSEKQVKGSLGVEAEAKVSRKTKLFTKEWP